MKRLNVILGLISAVLLIGPYAIFYVLDHGNPIMNAWVRSDAEKHLSEIGYQEKDYKENHVIELKTVINKDYFLTQYMVVFKDEPDMTYY
ncbi:MULTISPECIES: DUF3139 domain-containing protein [Bacillus]|uniref:DUF3139 domain-containing protein n=1 Tax=Bacillus glycinifermentans TaxID=1664069 RepID=A0AAJ3YVP6_9BACI|nr:MULTISPECIES: DUF3139 domain-containing protein [Bacillus]MDU0071200.1 DUF3139 domain-containing protein [Bacillus sp. IG6]MED8019068.1 DUF3139 domain-containing protein [Bacillus glycinifermentans]QAT63743.1 DUF3139 domain-containing protein [Bacillus glycinifermentans]WKB77616.1 DUF3139 domain-containing protein [Bacillus glycinifermentans]SCA84083.1 hypothetical protein BGLY_0260 [Bacillus glycinifermentans]